VLSANQASPAGDSPARARGSFGAAVAILTLVRIASIGAGFLATVIAARLIGADGLGSAGAALTIATIGALLANGGLNIAIIFHLGRRPEERVSIVAWTAALGGLATLLAAGVVLGIGLALRDAVLNGASTALLLWTAALGAGVLSFELTGAVLLGLERRRAYIAIQVVEALGGLALTAVILVGISQSDAGFIAAAALGYWLAAAVAAVGVVRHLGPFRPSFSAAYSREALGMGIRGQIGNVLQFLNLRLDLLLVPALLNLASAGVYLVAVRISEVITQVSSSAAAFLFPHVAGQSERNATTTTETTARMTLLIVIASGLLLALLADPILAIAFGPAFSSGAWTVRITLLAMIPLALVRLLASDLKGRGRPGIVSIAALLALAATVIFDLLLIPALGINGAALASLIAYTVSAAGLLVAYRRITGGALGALLPGPRDFVHLRMLAAAALGRNQPGASAPQDR
jgi:O-antigen/teichoic acid export membrane protein